MAAIANLQIYGVCTQEKNSNLSVLLDLDSIMVSKVARKEKHPDTYPGPGKDFSL